MAMANSHMMIWEPNKTEGFWQFYGFRYHILNLIQTAFYVVHFTINWRLTLWRARRQPFGRERGLYGAPPVHFTGGLSIGNVLPRGV